MTVCGLYAIICKSPRKSGWRTVLENWTVRDKYEAKDTLKVCSMCEENLVNSERENTTLKNSKWAIKLEIDLIDSSPSRLDTMISRVWSWLRINAGGVHNTFKSNGEPFGGISGGRVSNAWATCPCVGDNVRKRTLIPHNPIVSHDTVGKDLLRKDGLASD